MDWSVLFSFNFETIATIILAVLCVILLVARKIVMKSRKNARNEQIKTELSERAREHNREVEEYEELKSLQNRS